MGFGINLVFFSASLITLIISGFFSTSSAVRVTRITAWDKNPKLTSAHNKLSFSAVITWITVALIIVGIILFLVYGIEEAAAMPEIINIFLYILLLVSLIATIAVGILSAIASQEIADSGVSNNQNSRAQAITAAVLAIVGFVAIIVVFFVKMFYKPKKKPKVDKQKLLMVERAEMKLKRDEEMKREQSGGEGTVINVGSSSTTRAGDINRNIMTDKERLRELLLMLHEKLGSS